LAGFVGLVHAEDVVGISLDNQVLEVGDLIIAPKHWDALDAQLGKARGEVRAPSVEIANVGKSKVGQVTGVPLGQPRPHFLPLELVLLPLLGVEEGAGELELDVVVAAGARVVDVLETPKSAGVGVGVGVGVELGAEVALGLQRPVEVGLVSRLFLATAS
jgi:hypothetical protein